MDGEARHLLHVLPEAGKYDLSIHAGVWSGGDSGTSRFRLEKTALDEVLTDLGCANIVAISVGSGDMYNDHRLELARQVPTTDITLLVNQTQEIMDVLDQHGCCDVMVTHTDTFGDWLRTNFSEPLIRQVDFLTISIFPYWEGKEIDVSGNIFWNHVSQRVNMAAQYGKEVWIGETGWAVRGPSKTEAIANVTNLQQYWRQVSCPLMHTMN